MSHPVIPHTQPMASNALPIAQSVRILRTDGSIQLCSPVELVDNGAMERHRRDPAIVLRECRRSPCDAGRCRFVHFSEVPPPPPPPPPRVVPVQPVVLASPSVHQHHHHHHYRNPYAVGFGGGVPYVAMAPAPHNTNHHHHRMHYVPPVSLYNDGIDRHAHMYRRYHPLPYGNPRPIHAPVMVPHNTASAANVHPIPRLPYGNMLMDLHVAAQDLVDQQMHNIVNLPGLHMGHFRRGRGGSAMAQSTCCVCYEGLPTPATGYRCNSGHRTCNSCISHYIQQNWRTSGNEDVRCLSGDCSSPPMLIADIVRCASKEALAVYIDCYGRAKEAQAFAAAFRIVTDKPAAEALADIQQRQLVCSLSRARMCPECKYGPIDFYGCDDLSHHHGEEKNKKSFINNACPRCQFFASDVSSWDHWDGVVRVEEDPAHPKAETNSFTRRPRQGQFDDDDDEDDEVDDDAYDDYDYEVDDDGMLQHPRVGSERNLAEDLSPAMLDDVFNLVSTVLPHVQRFDVIARATELFRNDASLRSADRPHELAMEIIDELLDA